jgi:(p)ppGpp synthase/HD superfamily hydrolase
MSTLAKAIRIAAEVHDGQQDRFGAPYILHPLRVMMRMTSEEERIAAVLHDVIEDSDWTLHNLCKEGFSEVILQAVDCLTRRQGEPYFEYIERLKPNPLARAVKIADLEDNMDMKRIDTVTNKELDRLARYHQAWLILKTNKG